MSAKSDQATLAIRAVVFFAIHPEEALTGEDVAIKFDVPLHHVWMCLRRSVKNGLLEHTPLNPGRKIPLAYRAGNLLKEMIGAKRPGQSTMAVVMEACASLQAQPIRITEES